MDNDDDMLEILCLQIFQAGLNWNMIISKRDAFRKAFKQWRVDEVARMNSNDVNELLKEKAIIRNRMKIEACIKNASIMQQIGKQNGSFCKWFYQVMEGNSLEDFQKVLKNTFRFIGPELARMWLLSSGRISSD